jgi:hypothetical protein
MLVIAVGGGCPIGAVCSVVWRHARTMVKLER